MMEKQMVQTRGFYQALRAVRERRRSKEKEAEEMGEKESEKWE